MTHTPSTVPKVMMALFTSPVPRCPWSHACWKLLHARWWGNPSGFWASSVSDFSDVKMKMTSGPRE